MPAHAILTNSHGDAVSYAAEHTVWRGPKARMQCIRSRASARSRSASSSPVTSFAADGRTTGSIPSAQLPRASTCACERVAWDACPLAVLQQPAPGLGSSQVVFGWPRASERRAQEAVDPRPCVGRGKRVSRRCAPKEHLEHPSRHRVTSRFGAVRGQRKRCPAFG
jgi:hypothetical protein